MSWCHHLATVMNLIVMSTFEETSLRRQLHCLNNNGEKVQQSHGEIVDAVTEKIAQVSSSLLHASHMATTRAIHDPLQRGM